FRVMLIVGAALAFRMTVAPLSPRLSEDLYRYRWQGMLQAAGGNPYVEIPQDRKWAGLRDAAWDQVNCKDLPSVYGPAYELLYAGWLGVASRLWDDPHRQAWSFKLPFALLELGVGAALLWLLRLWRMPAERAVVYLWSPLIVVEFWAQGHNDPLAVLFVLLALCLAKLERWPWAFAALAVATMAKFWPGVLFPFFLLQRVDGRWRFRWKPALAAIPVALLLSLPYLGALANVTKLLEGFVGGWRNNDSLYGWIYAWANQDFQRGTTLVTRLMLAALAALWALRLCLLRAALWAPVVLLFLSANCFPWYLSWFLPLLALFPNAALLLWSATVVLAYNVLIPYAALGEWRYDDSLLRLEYWPVFGLLALTGLRRGYRRLHRNRASACSASGSPYGHAER
ncbi:MAG: hypothetical protein KDC27_12310, partial [Acidobacteria bacterium]|nr:hypothetical protein [Acidobacteriota bacterium]